MPGKFTAITTYLKWSDLEMAAQGNPKLSTFKKVKKLTLILLLLISTTCWGEWTKVAEGTSGTDWYIDFERIKKTGEYVYYWVMMDTSEPDVGGYISNMRYEMGDCEMFRKKTLQTMAYRHSMGEGEALSIPESALPEHGWNYPPLDSPVEWILKAACGQ